MKRKIINILTLFPIVVAQAAYAESSGVHVVNWYHEILEKFFVFFNPDMPATIASLKAEQWSPVFASAFAVLLVAAIAVFSGFSSMKPEEMSDEELLPPKKFGLKAFLELCWSVVSSTLESTIGEKNWIRFVGVLGGTFFVLIISNLSGVMPGFSPATASMSFTFAAAIAIFVYFNYYGLKEAGFSYIKHLAGPVLWMAPLMFLIEFISLLSRPVSLSLRIFGNISGDHFVFAIFSGLMKDLYIPFMPIPAIFLGFGTFVACLQAFIFMTLSAVYIKLALESKEHH
ncbi:F0F1 ATP synthase subunit A [Pigmentibacter sp. JX0631]|uniref:F0F1 ATP synthase subunit A n=1 Tax=Pigmentibacter sp. JX0631 TaxID=2976982 RepID=UPI0024693DAE|nr:F0F1 ATP synthase subunit A [Pigmentibacter sp. JX0631]WGL61383.1 F0F1 ATP synthase subunit A [Pigmentibacter sp. JX0631]